METSQPVVLCRLYQIEIEGNAFSAAAKYVLCRNDLPLIKGSRKTFVDVIGDGY